MSDFETAVADSKKLTSKPSDNDLLELYGLYKVATGEDITKVKEPGAFDFKGKYKYRSWKKYVDEGISQDEAKQRYVALVNKMKETYGYDANKVPEAVGGN